MTLMSNIILPVTGSGQRVSALRPAGPAAAAQTIDNTKVYTFAVAQGTPVRCACSTDLFIWSGNVDDTPPASVAALQAVGYLKAGASLQFVSAGLIWVCTNSATGVSFAPQLLQGSESND